MHGLLLMVLFGRIRRCVLVRGKILLEVGVDDLKTFGILSLTSHFCVYGS